MAEEKHAAEKSAAPATFGVPPVQAADDNPKAGPGQVVVTSPTGAKSVVDKEAVASLKPQGYRVG